MMYVVIISKDISAWDVEGITHRMKIGLVIQMGVPFNLSAGSIMMLISKLCATITCSGMKRRLCSTASCRDVTRCVRPIDRACPHRRERKLPK